MAMTDDEAFEQYGEVPLYFSHYYNFVFIYKSARLENAAQYSLVRVRTFPMARGFISPPTKQRSTLNPIFFARATELH
jgi:hypothetical protein